MKLYILIQRFVEKAMGSMFCSFLYFDFNYSGYCKFI